MFGILIIMGLFLTDFTESAIKTKTAEVAMNDIGVSAHESSTSIHNISSRIQCCAVCHRKPSCKYFAFDNSTCYLMSGQNPMEELSESNVGSGVKYYLVKRNPNAQKTIDQDIARSPPGKTIDVAILVPVYNLAPDKAAGKTLHEYTIFANILNTFDGANDMCKMYTNGKLATIHNVDDQSRVKDTISKESTKQLRYWIGLRGEVQKTDLGTCITQYKLNWTDEQLLEPGSGYQNFGDCEPHASSQKNMCFVMMYLEGDINSGVWATQNCEDSLGFVCQYDLY